MTSVNTEPLTPEFVRSATFNPARLGRRGLDEAHVHAFCQWVADDLARVLSENAMLHEEVLRLRDRVLERGGQADAGLRPEDGHVQAVYVLSKAQQTADRYVADAQEYSRDIAVEARRRHDDILREAQVRASMILDEAHVSASQAASAVADTREPLPASERQQLESEIAYLRTFSDVCRTHLRAYMESLTRSIEEWERAERDGAPVPGEPRLQPVPQVSVPQPLSRTAAGSSHPATRDHARGRRTGTRRRTRRGSRPTSRSRSPRRTAR
jgi:cell division septum initiation protein DivIVA